MKWVKYSHHDAFCWLSSFLLCRHQATKTSKDSRTSKNRGNTAVTKTSMIHLMLRKVRRDTRCGNIHSGWSVRLTLFENEKHVVNGQRVCHGGGPVGECRVDSPCDFRSAVVTQSSSYGQRSVASASWIIR